MKKVPSIAQKNNGFSFYLEEKPFIILGAEVHNSACTSSEYMQNVWERAKEIRCNTILAPVYWELIEPAEGIFDFSMVSDMIESASSHNLKLILLWFGSWKNGKSTYIPGWIKQDLIRFPRVMDDTGARTNTLSMFDSEIGVVETKAFETFMKYLKTFDAKEQTVIAVQVENEVGILDTSRDFSSAANNAYAREVPEELLVHLGIKGRNQNWEQIFSENAEIAFMSWHYARYIGALAAAGKAIYELPMFTNVWLRESTDEKPGTFPCGGPIPEAIDIWKCGAPALDVIAPDIYTFHFDRVANQYTRKDNPLMIPETRRDKWAVPNLYYAIGSFHAICFSPFGAESIGEDKSFINQKIHTNKEDKNVSSPMIKQYLSDSYQLIGNMMPTLTKYYGTECMTGFVQSETDTEDSFILGDYKVHIEYYHPVEDQNEYLPGAGIAIREGADEFVFLGYGYKATLELVRNCEKIDFLTLEKGYFQDNVWNRTMFLNGDEQHVQMEEKPTIIKVKYYRY